MRRTAAFQRLINVIIAQMNLLLTCCTNGANIEIVTLARCECAIHWNAVILRLHIKNQFTPRVAYSVLRMCL